MKKIFFCLILFFFSIHVEAQIDYSGNYSFQDKVFNPGFEIKPGKDDAGAAGDLTLLKIDSIRYKFWLSVNRGWPSYNQGDIDGIISVKNGNAFFSEKQDYTDSSCKIAFRFFNKYILVDQLSSDIVCGFGFHVFANGKYRKMNSVKIKNPDLQNLYIDFTKYVVLSNRCYLYEDTSGNKIKKQYFIKGNTIMGLIDNEIFVYTEFITSSGKFIYGWLKRSELNEIR